MATRFIGKNLHKRVVRPMKNSARNKNYIQFALAKEAKMKEEKSKVVEGKNVEEVEPKKENKKTKKTKEMVSENKLTQMEAIAGTNLPKQEVKVEKGDKGLYERTENSTILLTEDNKMVLND